ncbi:MAG: phosphoribosylamine--glycine ligase [Firmicutes bacterium]|nr:phosphoribosylamine--glycine ligase [Bacillota bacterium]
MKKNILIIGGGGREHAIAIALKKSPDVGKLYAIPGNAGMSEICECHSNITAMKLDKIIDFIASHPDIYLTMVAPDDPLAAGLVDKLNAKGFRAFGPSQLAAEIESSKVFSKGFMARHNIPTARYEAFDNFDLALAYIKDHPLPLVIKADGLALGKGVSICNTLVEAEAALKNTMQDLAFGSAGRSVVIEEFLTGFEVSVLAFCDGETVVPMVSASDYKRAHNGDAGLNTGGMGTISPSPSYTNDMAKIAMETIFLPTVKEMKSEGREFKGVLYFGLIICDGVPKVIEYNARFGDPETQVILPRLKTDLLEVFDACIDGTLDKINLQWEDNATVCVCLASGGYPLNYNKGEEISIGNNLDKDITIYHAGTAIDKNGKLVTNGGRVLNVVATAENLVTARSIAYANISKVYFKNMHYRTDIGLNR